MHRHRLVLINSCVILVLGLFSIDLYNPALPSIVASIHINHTQAESLVVFYLAGFALSQLWYGPASDRHGRVRIILISLLLAAIGNLLTAFARTGNELMLCRLVTGLGAGGCPVISRAVLSDVFKEKKSLTQALAVFSMASQISPAFAPMIGGVITLYLSWRYNFAALFLITLAGLCVVKATLPETHPDRHLQPTSNAFASYKILASNPTFMVYSVVSALLFAVTIGYYTISPFIFQDHYRLTPAQNGLLYVFYAVGIVIGSFATRKLVARWAPETVLRTSLTFLVVVSGGAVAACVMLPNVGLLTMLVLAFSIAVGCGVSSPLLLGLSLHPFPMLAGAGSALQGTIKMAGAGLTLWLIALIRPTDLTMLMAIVFALAATSLLLERFLARPSARETMAADNR
ncbi:multidrug effflux MFS transporter [Trinickia diaoshuihuensis]|uniref:multidrug effflux MFS transporter n=1 Tax=Trinickia diaoshuihuensis TaxID=2292265 RepID=UPI000E22AFA1|nr:multidrug effflux MFS transporter [Trinickia diaoshuihuensis]